MARQKGSERIKPLSKAPVKYVERIDVYDRPIIVELGDQFKTGFDDRGEISGKPARGMGVELSQEVAFKVLRFLAVEADRGERLAVVRRLTRNE